MSLVLFSAAKGPQECELAVAKALARFLQEATIHKVTVDILSQENGDKPGTLSSIVLSIEGDNAPTLIKRWQGTLLWVCQSPYRPTLKRKNWFIGITPLQQPNVIADSDIRFDTTKSSGAGGQHVNKTESAVRATHLATGISVKVQSERSQHANKRLARLLIVHKIAELNNNMVQTHNTTKHQLHQQTERGNANLTFYGDLFIEK